MSDTNARIDQMIDLARGAIKPGPEQHENRDTRRHPFSGRVALVQRLPDGGKSVPLVVMTRDFSAGGLRIASRYMLHVGHRGAILLMRSTGEPVLIGVRVAHCRYVGDMNHESGLEFLPEVGGLTLDDFRDKAGQLPELTPGSRKAA